MKRVPFVAFLALSAFVGLCEDEPSGPEFWYQPQEWVGGEIGTGYVYWGRAKDIVEYEIRMDDEGYFIGEDWENIVSQVGGNPSMLTALGAMKAALESQARIMVLPEPSGVVEFEKRVRVAYHTPNCEALPAMVYNLDKCGPTRTQGGVGNCAAMATATYSDFVHNMTGAGVADVNAAELYDAARVVWKATKEGVPLGAAFELLKLRCGEKLKDYGIARFYFPHGTQTEANVRAFTMSAVASFGGFVASVNATEEWFDLNAPSVFGEWNPFVIRGDNTRPTGPHCVLVCGYDNDGVIIQNTWGPGFGFHGFCKMTWGEYAREFESATFFARACDWERQNGLGCRN